MATLASNIMSDSNAANTAISGLLIDLRDQVSSLGGGALDLDDLAERIDAANNQNGDTDTAKVSSSSSCFNS